MKLLNSPVNNKQTNFDYLQPVAGAGKEACHVISNCVSVRNSPVTNFQKNDPQGKHADVIKRFLKKTIAAQSYHKMFSEGVNFKESGIELSKLSTRKASLYSLQHLSNVSKKYLTEIKGKTSNLTAQEKDLLRKVVDAKLHFRHQTNSNLAAKSETLNILSFNKLLADNVITGRNTFSEDVKNLSNHDFVFFGVEFSNDKDHLPLNTIHSTVDFGANAYIVEDRFPYGYLTLTDHLHNTVPSASRQEHKAFFTQFSNVNNEIFRKIHGEKGKKDVPVFNTRDMRYGLGLHLIDFLRKTDDDGFKDFAFNENLDGKDLDKILNFVFQPEFHIPRMVSTDNFKQVKLREISLMDAVTASNYEALSAQINDKKVACKAMGVAIRKARQDVVEYLFSKFTFSAADVIRMTPLFEDFGYLLSDFDADEKILEEFLVRGLVDPNKTFKKVNRGDTMLDNAIKYRNVKMISLLLEYGGKCGKEIKDQVENQKKSRAAAALTFKV